jgi:hypothetical protein
MTDNVKKFYTAMNPDHVLEQAIGHYPHGVIIVGYDEAMDIVARTSGNLSMEEVNFLLDVFKHNMMSGEYGGDF